MYQPKEKKLPSSKDTSTAQKLHTQSKTDTGELFREPVNFTHSEMSPPLLLKQTQLTSLGDASQLKTNEEYANGIPARLRLQAETVSGFSFSDVRVHYHSDNPSKLNAHAYTHGNQIYIAPNQERHLPHELGHVIQQKSGAVKPTIRRYGLDLNNDMALEREADHLLESGTIQRRQITASDNGVVQLAGDYTGILPKHESIPRHTDQPATLNDFTYHHIIPENLLGRISLYMQEQQFETDPYFKSNIASIKKKAAGTWIQTRAQNTLHELNRWLGNFDIAPLFTREQLLDILKKTPQLNDIHHKIATRIKEDKYFLTSVQISRVKQVFHGWTKNPDTMENFETLYRERLLSQRGYYYPPLDFARDVLESHSLITKTVGVNRYQIKKVADFADAIEPGILNNPLLAPEAKHGNLYTLLRANAIHTDHSEDLDKAIRWIPANIHRGPSARVSSGTGYDQMRDDGGDSFEKSAGSILSAPHIQELTDLNKLLVESDSAIKADKAAVEQWERQDPKTRGARPQPSEQQRLELKVRLKLALEKIDALYTGHPSMKSYDPSEWEEHPTRTGRWRFSAAANAIQPSEQLQQTINQRLQQLLHPHAL